MRLHLKLAFVAGALMLAAVPATAAAGPAYHPGPDYTPAPSPPPHAKAYGKYCQGKSKKHVKGEKGTEFSRCVKAMARADHNKTLTPRRACKGLSKKHVKGEKGTEFSRCVKAAAHLRRDQRRQEREVTIGKPDGVPPEDKGKGPDYTPAEPTPGPKAGLPEQAKAYGRYCQDESRAHVIGEKGTDFSQCVKNMAQAAAHQALAPGQVCKGESKKHVKGKQGTEFSRCVRAVVKLRQQERADDSA